MLQINVSAKVPLEPQSILSVTSSVPLVMLTPLLNSQTLSGSLYNILPPYSTSIPAPFEDAALVEFAANLIVRSLISTVVEFIVVVVPSTCKFPFTMTKPVSSPTTDGSMYKVEGPCICPPNTASPVTFNVLSRTVAPVTFNVLSRTVAPDTSSLLSK